MFAGQVPDFFPPIGLRGSPFRQRVYQQVLAIPYGSMCSYGEVAARLNRQPGFSATSARAVGNAVAHNPILLIVPCHRVVGTRGALTGYAAGVDRKAALLDMERRVSSRTYG